MNEAAYFYFYARTFRRQRKYCEMKVTGYPKTSGSTGLHIYIPSVLNMTTIIARLSVNSLLTRFKNYCPALPALSESFETEKANCILIIYRTDPKQHWLLPIRCVLNPVQRCRCPCVGRSKEGITDEGF